MSYTLKQLSLKEYVIENNLSHEVLKFKVYQYDKGKLSEPIRDITIDPESKDGFILGADGVYVLRIYDEDEEIIFDTYTIHNCHNAVVARQKYLTKSLTEFEVVEGKCNHNQYYDYITFNLYYDTYMALVQDTYTSASIDPDHLYKIWYIVEQLKKYYNE